MSMSKGRARQQTEVTETFNEGDDEVEFTAEGQMTDFASDGEMDSEEARGQLSAQQFESTQGSRLRSSSSDEDDEVQLSQRSRGSENNHANVATPQCRENQYRFSSSPGKNSRRRTEDEFEDKINTSLDNMQKYMDEKLASLSRLAEMERELAEKKRELEEMKARGKKKLKQKFCHEENEIWSDNDETKSELTIYRNAVAKATVKDRESSLSDELINTSDETDKDLHMQLYFSECELSQDRERDRYDQYDRGHSHERSRHRGNSRTRDNSCDHRNQCEGTRYNRYDRSQEREEQIRHQIEQNRQIEQKSDKLIRDAEVAKAQIYEVAGKSIQPINGQWGQEMLSALIDENYKLVGSHVEEYIQQKILNNEFVDFAQLLPWNRPATNEFDQKLHIYAKGGEISLAPAVDRNNCINSYLKWEQVFRVFSDIYTSKFTNRAGKLIQYNHIIHTASLSFAWENVYLYDVEFRLHMSKNPLRNWGVILQQAYTMFIKDRQNFAGTAREHGTPTSSNNKSKKLCYSFNRGKCSYGSKCHFDHRCGMCGKFGHGAFNCRKAGGVQFGNRDHLDKTHRDREEDKK